jgi:exodeoxyribonuclease VII large subunit
MTQDSDDAPPLLAPAPRPGSNLPEFSVGDLARAMKKTLEGEFGFVRVRGEISQPKKHSSGHCYLRLKDDTAVLESVIWRGTMAKIAVRPEEGMEVVAQGRITTYPGRSQYQMVIESLELAGEGALLKMLEERKRRLAAEGLFDPARKKKIPFLSDVIGVVTSPTGAVIRDILHRLADRFPCRVLVWPVAVQGEGAPAQIAAAIDGFNKLVPGGRIPRPDLIIVARGGGSLEDLMAFNEEIVVRAAAASRIPLISAVGHETDTTLIDFASDLRAPTPTAAAEMATPVRSELLAQVLDDARRLVAASRRLIDERRVRVDGLGRGLGDPQRLLETATQRLDDRGERLVMAAAGLTERRGARLAETAARLRHPREVLADAAARLKACERGLSAGLRQAAQGAETRLVRVGPRLDRPLPALLTARLERVESLGRLLAGYSYENVLKRGFALVRDESGKPVLSAGALPDGAAVSVVFHDGARAAVLVGGGAPASIAAPEIAEKSPVEKTRKTAKPTPVKPVQGSLF